jgi:inhibitor of cysteine peptidase
MDASRVLTVDDHGGAVTIRPGETVEVRLAENPTTGYRWQLEPLDADVADAYTASSAAAGAGGMRVFRVTARSAGDAEVRATLRRSWEPPENAPLQTFAATVQVR